MRSEMNFMEKMKNREGGAMPRPMGMLNIPSSSMSHNPTSSSSTNFHNQQYYYGERGVDVEGSSRSTAAPPEELDLMDTTSTNSPPHHRNNVNDVDGVDNDERVLMMMEEKEHMFDKVVTPSDVGKLNRLVIPKQHAEKYFPLDSNDHSNKQGLLLNFEDSNGKSWRFRYSYWNSSQSYVMTKGWSRFVKEKKLDAGDIVSFHRSRQSKDRLFIHWRRRPPPPPTHHNIPFSTHHNFSLLHSPQYPPPHHHYFPASAAGSSRSVPQGTGLFLPAAHALRGGGDRYYYPTATGYNNNNNNVFYGYGGTNNATTTSTTTSPRDDLLNYNHNPSGNSVIYFRSSGGAGVAPQYRHQQQEALGSSSGEFRGGVEQVFESVPVVQGKAAAKRLRLFGVNMDCPISHDDDEEEDEEHDITILPSTTTTMVLLPH